MSDLYSFTFDDNEVLPILARGSFNTIDTFDYTGDGRIYSKNNNVATDPIDIVNDFPWTKSPKTSRSDVPAAYVKEKRLLTNSTLANFFYSVLAGAEVLETAGDRIESGKIQVGSNTLKVFDEIKGAAGSSYPGVTNALNLVSSYGEKASGFVNDLKVKAENFLNEDRLTDKILQPYNGLYYTEDTGFKYFIPYLSNTYLEASSNFSEDSQKVMGLSDIDEIADTAFNAIRGAAFMDKPGVYVEQSKQYDFGQDGRTFNMNFPLLNTGTYEDIKRNWQLLFGLIYQNKPGRINRNLLEMPVIYEFFIEGLAYMPYSYITQISIDFIGNRRTMAIDIPSFSTTSENESLKDRTSISTVIPDAYNVSIQFQGLNKETRNFLIRSLGNPTIQVRERGTI